MPLEQSLSRKLRRCRCWERADALPTPMGEALSSPHLSFGSSQRGSLAPEVGTSAPAEL